MFTFCSVFKRSTLKSAEKFGGSTVIRQWVPDRSSANAERFLRPRTDTGEFYQWVSASCRSWTVVTVYFKSCVCAVQVCANEQLLASAAGHATNLRRTAAAAESPLQLCVLSVTQPVTSTCVVVGGGATCTGWPQKWHNWSETSPAWVRRPAARRTRWTFDAKTPGCDSYFRQ